MKFRIRENKIFILNLNFIGRMELNTMESGKVVKSRAERKQIEKQTIK